MDYKKCKENIPVPIVNLTDEDVIVYPGQDIGSIEESAPVVNRATKVNRVKSQNAKKEWSEGLHTLYDDSCEKLSSDEAATLKKLFSRHLSVFAKDSEDLGYCTLVQHTIDTGSARPIKQPPRRPPRAFADEEEKIIESQLRANVIQESNSPWSSPLLALVYVRKRSGEIRPCVDFRKLNYVTIKDAYSLPRIDHCLDTLQNAKYFSTLDLQSGYWQISIKPEVVSKTAFVTRGGLFEYKTMPFGLCNAPSTFQRCMEIIFRGIQWKHLLIYLDDIIIFSDTFYAHIER